MGSELQLKVGDKITIEATATINPDIDFLGSLALIEQGDVIKTVSAQKASETAMKLRHTITVRHGTWFIIRADGKRQGGKGAFGSEIAGPAKTALSGAIYVNVEGQSFWKPAAVPMIVERLRQSMEQLMAPETVEYAQTWETREPTLRLWDSQKGLLKQLIDEVTPKYENLAQRARAEIHKRRLSVQDSGTGAN
jgi:hypothetical protein